MFLAFIFYVKVNGKFTDHAKCAMCAEMRMAIVSFARKMEWIVFGVCVFINTN